MFWEDKYAARCEVQLGISDGDYTIEEWVKVPVENYAGTSRTLFSYSAEAQPDELQVDHGPGNKLYDHEAAVLGVEVDLSDGEWHHVVVSRRSCDAGCCYTSYLDGVVGSSASSSGPCPAIADGGSLVIGQRQLAPLPTVSFDKHREFVGSITELRVWKVARSPQQIVDNMHRRIHSTHPDFADLAGLWPFNAKHQFNDITLGLNHLGPCGDCCAETSHKGKGVKLIDDRRRIAPASIHDDRGELRRGCATAVLRC